MNTHTFRVLLFLSALTNSLLWAGGAPSAAGPQRVGGPLSEGVYRDFSSRLDAAVASQQLASVASLYQTNDTTSAELNSELARWHKVLMKDVHARPPFLKILSELPSESHDFWAAQAHRSTRHEVTHFDIQTFSNGAELILPLVLVGDKLLIVPSEKLVTKSNISVQATPGLALLFFLAQRPGAPELRR